MGTKMFYLNVLTKLKLGTLYICANISNRDGSCDYFIFTVNRKHVPLF